MASAETPAKAGEANLGVDRPSAAELLEIVAATLSETVVPATAPHAQHQARVAANLCLIIERELSSDPAPVPELPPSLIDCDDAVALAAFGPVVDLVRAKLATAKPGYDTHDAEAEAHVVT